MQHKLIDLSDLPDHGTALVPFFGREVHVWRHGSGARAAANTCMHLGGPLECRNGRLACPWHGASYDLATGAKTEGPGPVGARLMFLPTRIIDGAVTYVWGNDADADLPPALPLCAARRNRPARTEDGL